MKRWESYEEQKKVVRQMVVFFQNAKYDVVANIFGFALVRQTRSDGRLSFLLADPVNFTRSQGSIFASSCRADGEEVCTCSIGCCMWEWRSTYDQSEIDAWWEQQELLKALPEPKQETRKRL